MAYELYPAVDETYAFPPEVRAKLATSVELRNTVVPMTTAARNNLSGADLWDGRLILNTSTDRVNRYDLGTTSWAILVEQPDIASLISGAMPIGAIIAFAGSVAPTGWHLCNFTVHGSTALANVLAAGGHLNTDKTPDLRDKFILGDGGSQPVSGGAATVTLSAAESGLRAHTHPAGTTGNDNVDHYHGVDPPNTPVSTTDTNHQHYANLGGGTHSHNSAYGNNWQGSTQDQNPAGTAYGPIGWNEPNVGGVFTAGGHGHEGWVGTANTGYSHGHDVNIGAFDSGYRSTAHQHVFNTPSNTDAAAASAHNNMPPFYTLTYIIKTI